MEQTTAREIKTFSLTLDMMRAMRSHPFEVVAGDTGNVLEVRLENDGAPVPLSGRYVCMVFRSGIGTALQDTDSGITLGEETGTFSIALLPGSYGPGDVSADVQVYSGAARETLITSTRFTFRCRNALLSEETMRAQAAYPPLIAATEEAAGAADAAQAAAAACTAQAADMAAAETARALAEDAREAAYTGAGFEDEMLVMANFPAGMMNTFLGLFRRMGIAPVALKAMLTPTNAAWDSEKLHEELAGEHRAMTSGEGKRHQG